jgi:hypothetical protein
MKNAYLYQLLVTALMLKTNDKNSRQECAGIYSKQDWGGSKNSFIDVALTSPSKDDNQWIAVVIFEYRNVDLLGVHVNGDENKKYICDDSAVAAGLCDSNHIGTFLVSESANSSEVPPLYAEIITQRVNVNAPEAIRYSIKKTGYYCVSTYPSDGSLKYTGAVLFQNAFGHLAASQIPKLPFYGGAALAYLVVFALWMFSYVQHRSDILPVQNYITAICGFLVVEMIVIWGYYDLVNNSGSTAGTIVYLAFLSVLNAFRNAFTFFLLLIVCLGYGVVKPTLGSLMWKCRALAAAHFLFAVLYTVSSFLISPENAGPVVLLVVMPLALTMTTFYVWILSSLTNTIKYLDSHKQHVKANMYKNLWRILLGSIVVIFVFFFLNSLIFARESTLEFVTNHWQSRWFLLDGWLNVVYFVDFCLIAFIWRPTANNRRFAMSTQLAQDESEAQEFEIGSLRESLDEERDVGQNPTAADFSPPDTDESDTRPAATKYFENLRKEDGNEGETMFDVGDDDDDGHTSGAGILNMQHIAEPSGVSHDQWDEDDDDDDGEDILSGDDDESQQLTKKRA